MRAGAASILPRAPWCWSVPPMMRVHSLKKHDGGTATCPTLRMYSNEAIPQPLGQTEDREMIYDTMLITGCAGDIALALARIAREAGAVRRLIGCDVHADHAGPAFFDAC